MNLTLLTAAGLASSGFVHAAGDSSGDPVPVANRALRLADRFHSGELGPAGFSAHVESTSDVPGNPKLPKR